jgi:threonine synthase
MGEADTPLVELERTGEELDIDLYAKLESLNPTCSFKDRGSALSVSVAADPTTDYEGLVVASTGNTATSVAAYAARAAVPCAILVPEGTGMAKLSQAAAHGVQVFTVDGDFSECFSRAQTVSSDRLLNATAVYSANPYIACADRTLAFELFRNLGEVPDWVSIPVGAGPLLGGTHDGFVELANTDLTGSVPSMLCVQARGCHPVVEAFDEDRSVTAWEEPITTDVGAIADPLRGYPADGERTRQAVIESGGDAIALDDDYILEWTDRLAEREGIYAEPASAASVAALAESDAVGSGEVAVAVVTGHGLKEGGDHVPEVEGEGTVERVRDALLN